MQASTMPRARDGQLQQSRAPARDRLRALPAASSSAKIPLLNSLRTLLIFYVNGINIRVQNDASIVERRQQAGRQGDVMRERRVTRWREEEEEGRVGRRVAP